MRRMAKPLHNFNAFFDVFKTTLSHLQGLESFFNSIFKLQLFLRISLTFPFEDVVKSNELKVDDNLLFHKVFNKNQCRWKPWP